MAAQPDQEGGTSTSVAAPGFRVLERQPHLGGHLRNDPAGPRDAGEDLGAAPALARAIRTGEIHAVEAEPRPEAVRPLEVVGQRPVEVAEHAGAALDGVTEVEQRLDQG